MQKFHIALEVEDIVDSVHEYSKRLGHEPEVVVAGEYALWRTDTLNFSIRKGINPGTLRHLGFEDSNAPHFSKDTDVNGVVWEHFTAKQQQDEIENIWGK
jgi:hypothetical protein